MNEHPTRACDAESLPISTALEIRSALALRDLDARTVATLRANGAYDPDKHDVIDAPPLSVDEHLAVMAYGTVIARHVLHPVDVDRAVRAGATWDQVAEALDRPQDQVRRDYVKWADGQRDLSRTYLELGMAEADYAEAVALADLGSLPTTTERDHLSARARANLDRCAEDLGMTPGALLEHLALHVESERAGRIMLATPTEQAEYPI